MQPHPRNRSHCRLMPQARLELTTQVSNFTSFYMFVFVRKLSLRPITHVFAFFFCLFCHVFVVWLRFLLLLLVLLQKRSVEMRRSITKMSMHQLEQTLIIIAAKLLFFDVRHIITSSKQSMHRDVRLNWFMTHSLILFFFLFLWVFTQCHCSDGFSGRLISRFERKLLRKKSKWNIAYCTCTYRTNYSQWLQKLWIKIRPHWIHFQKQKSQTKKRNKQQQQYVLYLFFNCNCTKTDKQKQNQNHCENVLLCLLFVFYVWMGGGGGVGIYEFCPLVRCVFQCVPYVLMLFSFSSAAVQYLQYPKIFAIRF